MRRSGSVFADMQNRELTISSSAGVGAVTESAAKKTNARIAIPQIALTLLHYNLKTMPVTPRTGV